MRNKIYFVLGFFGSLLNVLALYGLWDVARHQVELNPGWYDLPFGYTVPYYIAGDLFWLMGALAMFLYLAAVLIQKRRKRQKKKIEEETNEAD